MTKDMRVTITPKGELYLLREKLKQLWLKMEDRFYPDVIPVAHEMDKVLFRIEELEGIDHRRN